MDEVNEAVVKKNMITHRLAQFRVARFFIKKMVTFPVFEDREYHEQTSLEWKACSRDTIRGTIGECFLVTAADINHTIRTVLNEEDFLLEDEDTEMVKLFSLLFRVLVFLRMSQTTHMAQPGACCWSCGTCSTPP